MLLKIRNHDDFHGSRLFADLSDFTGIALDKMNFMVIYLIAFVLAGLLRSSLSIEKVSIKTRHVFNIVIGIFFGYFCFGKHVLHLTGFSTLMYAVIWTQNPKFFHIQVFILSFFYLSCVHAYLQFVVDYDINTLDITGPLMVMTAKVTSLACSLHDGLSRREEELTPFEKKRLVKEIPKALEYYSFMFSFLTLLAGPVTFYDEHEDFIHSRQMQEAQKKISSKELNSRITFVALKKVMYSFLPIIVAYPLLNAYKVSKLTDNEFMEKSSFLYQLWYMNMLVSVRRFHYYFAWLFAEAICNNAGFGLNGLDENNRPRMDQLTNINIWKLETATNIYEYSKYWNSVTIRWLRFVVYDRVPYLRRHATYLTSTVWHGFHFGYYLSVSHGILYVCAERSVRRHVRPRVLASGVLKLFYDLLTIFTTRITIVFLGILVIVSETDSASKFYRELYFIHLIVTILSIILPPVLLPIKKEPRVKENENENDKNKVE